MSYVSYYRPPALRDLVLEALSRNSFKRFQVDGVSPEESRELAEAVRAASQTLHAPLVFEGKAVDVLKHNAWHPSDEAQISLARSIRGLRERGSVTPSTSKFDIPYYGLYQAIFGRAPIDISKVLSHNPLGVSRRGLASYRPLLDIDQAREMILGRLSGKSQKVASQIFDESVWGSELVLRGELHWKGMEHLLDEMVLMAMLTDPHVSPMDKWLIKLPMFQAIRDQRQIAQIRAQDVLRGGMVLASVPCGRMDDLLTLDFGGFPGIRLVGIDADPQALAGASLFADGLLPVDGLRLPQFVLRDPLKLGAKGCFDLCLSHGFSGYLDDKQRFHFFHALYEGLKPGGRVLLSHATRTPEEGDLCEWDMAAIVDKESLALQTALFQEIAPPRRSLYNRESEHIRIQLKALGFKDVVIHWDEARIFPTFEAVKPG